MAGERRDSCWDLGLHGRAVGFHCTPALRPTSGMLEVFAEFGLNLELIYPMVVMGVRLGL